MKLNQTEKFVLALMRQSPVHQALHTYTGVPINQKSLSHG